MVELKSERRLEDIYCANFSNFSSYQLCTVWSKWLQGAFTTWPVKSLHWSWPHYKEPEKMRFACSVQRPVYQMGFHIICAVNHRLILKYTWPNPWCYYVVYFDCHSNHKSSAIDKVHAKSTFQRIRDKLPSSTKHSVSYSSPVW